MALANILSEMPDLLERTLDEHTADSAGYCRECRDASGISATWPCATRQLAEQARSMSDAGPTESSTETVSAGTVAGRRRARDLDAAASPAAAVPGNGRHRSP